MVFSLRRPRETDLRARVAAGRDLPFSYAEVGASRAAPPVPAGYALDHNRVLLGVGAETFARACTALRRWEMFRLGWFEPLWPDTPIAAGAVVGVLARHHGLFSLHLSRIVYVFDDEDGSAGGVRRFGFAYGTLLQHGERGEERFLVEWTRADDRVHYDLLAFSRPHHPLARLAGPLARALQRRFARDSLAAMRAAVAGTAPPATSSSVSSTPSDRTT